MIRNISYHTLELKQEITETVGNAYSMIARFKLRGVGSQRYRVLEASENLRTLFERDSAANFCNIELRQAGIMLRFRSKQETYGWLIPYRSLTIFKGESSFSIYDGTESLRLEAAHNAKLKVDFIHKMIRIRAESLADSARFYA